MALAGSTPAQWSAKHVVAHHIDTNIVPVDDDSMYPFKRMLVALPRRSWHRYQHIYMWPFYCVTTMLWSVSNLMKLAIGYDLEGVTRVRHHDASDVKETWAVMLFFTFHRFVLPFVLALATGAPWYRAPALILLSEVSCSLWFALQFVVNHEVVESVKYAADAGADAAVRDELTGAKTTTAAAAPAKAERNDWGEWQVLTSHNFAPRSWLALHTSGGLNTQIEHHLFPSVHFSHYRQLSAITRQTCAEFGIAYNESDSFALALRRHYDALHTLGHHDTLDHREGLAVARADRKKTQ
mmetsp:Transcript_54100/g.132653  ORF Transcript_54100/g.132653 Transcript_54100/m.132653 type:complete len:296 (-) Transcript_54100:128-1015(-)